MTELLEKAIGQLKRLPEADQGKRRADDTLPR